MSDLRTPPKLDEEEANTPAPFQEDPEGVDYSTLSPSRSSGERSRDALLRLLDGTIFQYLGLMVLFLVVVDGAFFFFLLIGAQRMCRPRTDCDPRNGWYNISIQILNILFTYMATVSMPWRCTNAIHLFGMGCPMRSNAKGKNLYGLDVNEIWFHVPIARRRGIIIFLLLNCLTQYANQVTRIVYFSYSLQNQSPGNIWTNGTYHTCMVSSLLCNNGRQLMDHDSILNQFNSIQSNSIYVVFFASSMICAAIGGGWQGYEESILRKADPVLFPPGPLQLAKQYLCCKDKEEKEEAPVAIEGQDPTRAKTNRAVIPLSRSSMRLWAM